MTSPSTTGSTDQTDRGRALARAQEVIDDFVARHGPLPPELLDDARRAFVARYPAPLAPVASDVPRPPPAGLTASATVAELVPVLQGWAGYLERPVRPSRKLVDNWVWQRARSGFPDAVGERWHQGIGRWVRTYDVLEVLTWYCEYAPSRGGRPPGS